MKSNGRYMQRYRRLPWRAAATLVAMSMAVAEPGRAEAPSAGETQYVELGALLKAFMVADGDSPRWSMLAVKGGVVRWVTDGLEFTSGTATRVGTAYVTVDGKAKTALRQLVEDVEWNITLQSDGNPAFGPDSVKLEPQDLCFGSVGSGCDFELLPTLSAVGIRAERLCEEVDRGNGVEVFRLDAPGKATAWAAYWIGTGSAGTTNWVTLYWQQTRLEEEDDEELLACLGRSDAP